MKSRANTARLYLGIESCPTSHLEKAVAGLGAFLGIYLVYLNVGPVSGRVQIEGASRALDRLAGVAVFTVGDPFSARWESSSDSNAASVSFFINGVRTPSFPVISLPNCGAFRALSKSTCRSSVNPLTARGLTQKL